MSEQYHSEGSKIVELDWQVKRLVSDRESDKRAMKEIHSDHENRLRALETHYAKASGVLIAISVGIQLILHFVSK